MKLAEAAYGPVDRDEKSGVPLYWCPCCGSKSTHQEDIAHKFCGWCGRYADDIDPTDEDTPRALMIRALAALLLEDPVRFRAALRPVKLPLAPEGLDPDDAESWYVEQFQKQYP
jgi:hypothetical protein